MLKKTMCVLSERDIRRPIVGVLDFFSLSEGLRPKDLYISAPGATLDLLRFALQNSMFRRQNAYFFKAFFSCTLVV